MHLGLIEPRFENPSCTRDMLSGGNIMIKKCFYCKHYIAKEMEICTIGLCHTHILNIGRCVHRAHLVDDSFSCDEFEQKEE